MGVPHGMIAPGHNMSAHPVQVASVQTLIRRLQKFPMHYQFDLIVVDEAHHATAGSWRKVIELLPNAKLLGVTATPIRSDGQGLGAEAGGVFDAMVEGPTMADLIELGYLVRPVVYAPPTALDLTGVRKRGGDWDAQQVAERMDKPVITGSAVGHYRKLAHNKPAIAFCASVAHAQHVAAEFRAAGYVAQSIDGNMLDTERKAAIEGLATGKIHVLTSCDIISEGTDIPVVEVAILLRPTQSLSLYIQQVGRALRTAPGKDKAIILDHVGNVLRHGMPDEERDWSLDGSPRTSRAANDNQLESVRQCPKCYAAHRPAPVCPQCGHQYEIKERQIEQVEGQLQEMTAEQVEAMRREKRREEGNARTLEDLQELARKRGYAPGWAYNRWKARQKRAA